MPGNWLYIGAILAMLRGARVIACQRDPLETCFACYRQMLDGNEYTHDFDDLASYWKTSTAPCATGMRSIHSAFDCRCTRNSSPTPSSRRGHCSISATCHSIRPACVLRDRTAHAHAERLAGAPADSPRYGAHGRSAPRSTPAACGTAACRCAVDVRRRHRRVSPKAADSSVPGASSVCRQSQASACRGRAGTARARGRGEIRRPARTIAHGARVGGILHTRMRAENGDSGSPAGPAAIE